MIRYVRVMVTFFYVATVIPTLGLAGLVPGRGKHLRLKVRRRWIRWILHGLNVELTWQGDIPREPAILVANHRSWLDPLLILRHVLALPVAKAEMSRWPLLGTAGRLSGIFYVRRESPRDRQRTLEAVAEAVRQGDSILIFPEGTTHGGDTPLPFKKGVFQVAASHGVPIIPVALDFDDPGDYWLGNDTFVGHFLRRFGRRKVRCRVHIGPPLCGADSRILLTDAHDWIRQNLREMRQGLPASPR